MSFSLKVNRQISSNAFIKLFSEVIGRIATFVLVLLAARQLGEADFGLYNYGLALGYIVAQLADLGLQVLLAREIAASHAAAKPLVLAALRLKLLLSVGVILILVWLTAAFPPLLRFSLLALGLTLLSHTYLEFTAYIFRGQQRLLVEAQLLGSARVVTAVFGIIILWLGGGLLGLALTQLISTIIFVSLSLWWLQQAGWLDSFKEIIHFHYAGSRQTYQYLVGQAFPIGIAIFLSIAYTRLAILVLQYRLGEVAVAHFSAAHRLVEPAQIIPASLVAAAFPAFTSLLREESTQAQQLGVRVSVLLAVMGVGVTAVFWLSADWLIPFLYGSQFVSSISVLRWLSLSIVPAFINYSLTHYLIALGKQLYMGVFTAVMLILHLILSWQLIPHWGLAGPAISVTVAEIVLFLGCLLTLTLTKPKHIQIQST
jgi:O-antigen/teichoic acid export membrane protein